MPKDSKKIIDIFLEAMPILDKKSISKAVPVGKEIDPLTLKAEANSELSDLINKLRSCFAPSHLCPYNKGAFIGQIYANIG